MWRETLTRCRGRDGVASGPLDPDDAFEVLSNRRRRYVIHHLIQHGETTELRPLSRQVAAWENYKSLDQVTSEERRRVYNALQQFHLPKLQSKGVVAYESGRGTVRATSAARGLRVYLGSQPHPGCRSVWVASGALVAIAVLLAFTVVGVPALGAVVLVGGVGVAITYGGRETDRFGATGEPPELARVDEVST